MLERDESVLGSAGNLEATPKKVLVQQAGAGTLFCHTKDFVWVRGMLDVKGGLDSSAATD